MTLTLPIDSVRLFLFAIGRTMLIFSPDARMVEMILTTLPYKVKQEATQRINAIKADSEKE